MRRLLSDGVLLDLRVPSFPSTDEGEDKQLDRCSDREETWDEEHEHAHEETGRFCMASITAFRATST